MSNPTYTNLPAENSRIRCACRVGLESSMEPELHSSDELRGRLDPEVVDPHSESVGDPANRLTGETRKLHGRIGRSGREPRRFSSSNALAVEEKRWFHTAHASSELEGGRLFQHGVHAE